jgi:hypothetical protein
MTFEDFLKKEIQKTGYPLEIEVSSKLDKDWEDVYNTDSYFDKQEEKLRDIDVSAKKYFSNCFPLVVATDLDIECKKNENFVWVFFTRPFEFNNEVDVSGQYIDELQIRTKRFDLDYISQLVMPKTSLHYSKIKRVAVSFDEFPINVNKNKYEEGKKQIFEAQNQLTKYVTYTNELSFSEPPQEAKFIYFAFPCIVFDGTMYEAILKDGRIEVRLAKHLVLTRSSRTSYSYYDLNYLIDIVTKSHFDSYLKEIKKDVASIFEIANKHRRRILRELDKWSVIRPQS